MTITDEEVAALKAKAEAATQDGLDAEAFRATGEAFYEAANPTAILALIERASGQGDVEDAARYRWLRAYIDDNAFGKAKLYADLSVDFYDMDASLDTAIDVAICAKQFRYR